MTAKHFEQLHHGQGWLGLTVFIPIKCIDPTPEDFGRLALVKIEFLAHMDDVARINDGRIHLLGRRAFRA